MQNPLDLGFDSDVVISQDKILREMVPKIHNWIQTQNDSLIPKTLTNAQIIHFIVSCNYIESDIQKCIVSYFNVRQKAPELFTKRNILSSDLQRQLSVIQFYISPVLTDEGYCVILSRYTPEAMKYYDMEACLKLCTMQMDLAIFQKSYKGIICIQDMANVSLRVMTKIRISIMNKFVHYILNCLPIRVVALHTLNTVPFFDQILAIIKRFVDSDSLRVIQTHPSGMDMESFYANHVPRKCLPIDYGGDEILFEDMNKKLIQQLEEIIPYFDAEERQRRKNDVNEI